VITESVLVGSYWGALQGYALFGAALRALLRGIVAAAPGALIVHFVRVPSLMLQTLVVLLCGVVYGALAYAFGCVSREDIALLRGALAARSRASAEAHSNGNGSMPGQEAPVLAGAPESEATGRRDS
jgi:hypothetical protein